MKRASDKGEFVASGFMVRLPILPFYSLRASAVDNVEEQCADRTSAERVADWATTPLAQEAIYLASRDLSAAASSLAAAELLHDEHLLRALARYWIRMSSRATPFAAFATCSAGRFGSGTRFEVSAPSMCRRTVRLDFEILTAIADLITRDEHVRERLPLRWTRVGYLRGEALRYIETSRDGEATRYSIAEVPWDDVVREVAACARVGCTRYDLRLRLQSLDILPDSIDETLDAFIDAQLLSYELAPVTVGDDPLEYLLAQLGSCPDLPAVRTLQEIQSALRQISAASLGVGRAQFETIAKTIEAVWPIKLPKSRWLAITQRPSDDVVLPASMIHEISNAARVLHDVSPTVADPLRSFRVEFAERYGSARVPLLQVLDPELGIAIDGDVNESMHGAAVIRGLGLGPVGIAKTEWNNRDAILLRLVAETVQRGDVELTLSDDDIARLRDPAKPDIPDSISVQTSIAAESPQHVDSGDYTFFMQGYCASGSSLLGRFCLDNSDLLAIATENARAEESLRPDCTFAEVVHLSMNRDGNVLARASIRSREIVFLGSSSASKDAQIGLDELSVSVEGGRFHLWSSRLGCEVLPRLTHAHSAQAPHHVRAYRFLSMIQVEGSSPYGTWTWGSLARLLPFLPRVRVGRAILARAEWQIPITDLDRLRTMSRTERAEHLAALRARYKMPRHVLFGIHDNLLTLDLEDDLVLDVLAHIPHKGMWARFVELFPSPELLIASDGRNAYVHELNIPMVRQVAPQSRSLARPEAEYNAGWRLPPGSDWLYVKLYGSNRILEELLIEKLAPILDSAVATRAAKQWFFIRYADPRTHLRIRILLSGDESLASLLRQLKAEWYPLVSSGLLERVQLDTYEREVTRYGGPSVIEYAEAMFCADSSTALMFLRAIADLDSGPVPDRAQEEDLRRIEAGLFGVHHMLAAAGLDLNTRQQMVSGWRDQLAADLGKHTGDIRVRLKKFYRAHRARLLLVLESDATGDEMLRRFAAAARLRRPFVTSACLAWNEAADRGHLTTSVASILGSLSHMHINRLFACAPRQHELLIYDALTMTYAGQLARATAAVNSHERPRKTNARTDYG